jgi:hypothetical protein
MGKAHKYPPRLGGPGCSLTKVYGFMGSAYKAHPLPRLRRASGVVC